MPYADHYTAASILLAGAISIPDEVKRILLVAGLLLLLLLAAFFAYSVLVTLLYWLVFLFPLFCFAGGVVLWLHDHTVGNVVLGGSLVLGIIWVLLVTSKRPNVLRRMLDSLNRSLP